MKGRVCMNSTAQTACYSADSELMNKKFLTPKDLMYLMDIGELQLVQKTMCFITLMQLQEMLNVSVLE